MVEASKTLTVSLESANIYMDEPVLNKESQPVIVGLLCPNE
jgi:hypothetical protein